MTEPTVTATTNKMPTLIHNRLKRRCLTANNPDGEKSNGMRWYCCMENNLKVVTLIGWPIQYMNHCYKWTVMKIENVSNRAMTM